MTGIDEMIAAIKAWIKDRDDLLLDGQNSLYESFENGKTMFKKGGSWYPFEGSNAPFYLVYDGGTGYDYFSWNSAYSFPCFESDFHRFLEANGWTCVHETSWCMGFYPLDRSAD